MKEKVVISYSKGISHSPSDLLCGDGELEECVNLEVRNGEIAPMEMPVPIGVKLNPGEVLVLVHDIKAGPKNYIVSKDGTLYAFQMEGNTRVNYSLNVYCGELKSIQKLGNTIIAYSVESPFYFVYKNNEYTYLGSSIPNLGLSFNLEGKMVVSELFNVDVPSKSDGDGDTADNADLSTDENKEKVTNQIIPQVNKFIAEESEAKGKFIFPFFARYAYKLFDGTYTMQSSPVLLMPSTTLAPLCGYLARQEQRPPFRTFIAAIPSILVIRRDGNYNLTDWSDVISEICIFVSAPIRTYDQEGKIDSFSYSGGYNTPSNKSTFYGSLNSGGYKKYNINDVLGDTKYDETNFISSHNLWDLPSRDSSEIAKTISECSLFYKYTSFSPSYIDSNTIISIYPESAGINPVSDIEVGETLPDDYMTHDILIPEQSFVYNGRLNISNIRRKLFEGYSAAVLSQVGLHSDNISSYTIYTYIRTQNGDKVVKSPSSGYIFEMYGIYLFYPDSDAYKMVICDNYANRYSTIVLTEHPALNGAYYFGNFNDLQFASSVPDIYVSSDPYEYLTNKLFVSGVNNPFHFPLNGIYTVGSGEIIGMSAITRPISQGQFGEFPLIAFCSDGNYALRVDEQGFYTSISPVQEDIVLGGDKIAPMENSIMIITKKGLMLTSGGEMNKIALQMEGGVLDCSSLDGVKTSNPTFAELVDKSADETGFLSYLYGARMAFDYSSNRIFIYNPEKTYSYIYKFENDTVSKMVINGGSKVITSVIDYPDTIIQDETGVLYSLYSKDDLSTCSEIMYGLIVTRPLKMGGAMDMKSIRQVKSIEANRSNDSYVKYNLYGSNDNVKYYKISSRFGKPYKYYRVAIYTSLLMKESLPGTVFTVEERRTHKLR